LSDFDVVENVKVSHPPSTSKSSKGKVASKSLQDFDVVETSTLASSFVPTKSSLSNFDIVEDAKVANNVKLLIDFDIVEIVKGDSSSSSSSSSRGRSTKTLIGFDVVEDIDDS
jgi:hypothetical protein